jgi:5-formyltetrahydrofolate cyclo-ligase
MPKRSIREQLLAQRRRCTAETILDHSFQIQRRFLLTDDFRRAGCIALYSPVLNEVHTDEVARECLHSGKRLVYPRVCGERLELVEVDDLALLTPGSFGIQEPSGDRTVEITEVDLLVIPAIAFDQSGHRLGYGKGFYDRELQFCKKTTERVGFGYDFQLLDRLPAESHDRPLSMLITETRLLRFVA